jgi:hypothetical protein
MSAITIVDNEYATLLYYPEEKIVHHIMHQTVTGQDFRDLLNQGTELMRENHADKWLSDDRNNTGLSAEDTEWGLTVWFAQTQAAGWKYWALVVPDTKEGQQSMIESVQAIAKEGVRTMVFTDPETALVWLKSV